MVAIKPIDTTHMRGNFSTHAGDYDRYASVQKRVVELLCSQLISCEITPGFILDVGTGTGSLAATVSSVIPANRLVVMDIAHGMTRQAEQRIPSACACDGDAIKLPFVSGSFATVVSSSVYQWVDCLPTAFTEVSRVLQPGGLFAMALFGERTLHELRSSHCRAVADNMKDGSSHVQSFPALGDVSAALSSAGLSCHELYNSMEVEYHNDVPDLLRQLKQIGASNAAADRPRGLASRKIMLSMMNEYENSFRCEKGLPASYEVIIAVAEKLVK